MYGELPRTGFETWLMGSMYQYYETGFIKPQSFIIKYTMPDTASGIIGLLTSKTKMCIIFIQPAFQWEKKTIIYIIGYIQTHL